jgi:hypothetical protein
LADGDRERLTVRFRKLLDADLRQATKNLSEGELSNLARNGLRLMLGIRTTKKIQVTESVLSLPAGLHEINHESLAQGTERQVHPPRPSMHAAGKPLLNVDIKKDGRG